MLELLTVTDAAKVLGVSGDAVRLYERQGKLPAQRTRSGQRLFSASDVEALAAQRQAKRSDDLAE